MIKGLLICDDEDGYGDVSGILVCRLDEGVRVILYCWFTFEM